jgi:perosamine synthetase
VTAPKVGARRIPWWEPIVGLEERAAVAAVVDSNYLNEGDVTAEFERQVAELLGVKHAVAATSGTTAIFLALAALGIGHGDEVIVPDVTFIATANAVVLTGAIPVLVDVDPATLNIDPSAVDRAVTARTRAIVPVHVSGRAAAMADILDVARRRGVPVVEDAAEALLSQHQGRYLGTFGTAGCFSFSPNKTITTGQGGLVVSNDDRLVVRLRELKDQGRPMRGTGGDDIHASLGFNFKLTNLQAAVGVAQLPKLAARAAHLRDLSRWYRGRLTGVRQVTLLPFDVDSGETPQWIDALVDDRDSLVAHLREHDVHCRPFWFPIHTQKPYAHPDAAFPVSSALMPRAVWLPSALSLTEADVDSVCARIRDFYGH